MAEADFNTTTETDRRQIKALFAEICSINQQISILADAMACGNLDADAVESICILSKQAGMFADMGMQKFGLGAVGGPAEWLFPSGLRESAA